MYVRITTLYHCCNGLSFILTVIAMRLCGDLPTISYSWLTGPLALLLGVKKTSFNSVFVARFPQMTSGRPGTSYAITSANESYVRRAVKASFGELSDMSRRNITPTTGAGTAQNRRIIRSSAVPYRTPTIYRTKVMRGLTCAPLLP